MISLGPRVIGFTDQKEQPVEFRVIFEIDDAASGSDQSIDARATVDGVEGVFKFSIGAEDAIQACNRLMMLVSAHLSSLARDEGLTPVLGELSDELETGFEMFRY